jgi:hypothetical protein
MNFVPRYAILGLLAAMTVACSAGTATKAASTRSNPSIITREAVESTDRANAYELVRALRPNWLSKRGVQTITQGTGDIMIYYGTSRLGGTDALRSVDVQSIEQLQFISGSDATQRYGTNHEHGVILITPRGSAGR